MKNTVSLLNEGEVREALAFNVCVHEEFVRTQSRITSEYNPLSERERSGTLCSVLLQKPGCTSGTHERLAAITTYCESKDGASETNEMIRPHISASFHSNVPFPSYLDFMEDCRLLSSVVL